MKVPGMTIMTAAVLLLAVPRAHAQPATASFGFNAAEVSGALTGKAFLTGGGSYDPATGFVKAGGAFRCLEDVNQGPLSGCKAGEGVRWEGVQLLPSTGFKCSGVAGELLKTATTDRNTVVILAEFYRQRDGARASFTARMIVSSDDEATDLPGTQSVWIQGVGCADTIVNFR